MLYLDHAASAPIRKEVKDFIIDCIDIFGNPSSLHEYGLMARQLVETARTNIAEYVGVLSESIIFTSGASMSNTIALNSARRIVSSPIEHASMNEYFQYTSKPVHMINVVGGSGELDCEKLKEVCSAINSDELFVAIQAANNEIGTIQNIDNIADIVHYFGGVLFVDATQIFPYLNGAYFDIGKVDILSASAHKCGGLSGSGILYIRPDVKSIIKPIVFGHQEDGIVGGTENVLGIASFGEAIKYMPSLQEIRTIELIRDKIINLISTEIENSHLNGSIINRLPGNINIRFDGVKRNDQLVSLLGDMGYAVSAGSACNSSILEPSYVLKAIGLTDEEANSSIRITIDNNITSEDIISFINTLSALVEMLRRD